VSAQERRGWAIRWRKLEVAPDGSTKKVLRYEALGKISRGEAVAILTQRLATAGTKIPTRSLVTFQTLVSEWMATVLPMYKQSTQKNHRHILDKHVIPRFGEKAVADVARQEIQAFVAHLNQSGYAPKSIDHIHDVLSAILRTAVKWSHLADNPARGVDLPPLKTVRPKWALTQAQAVQLLGALPPLGRAMAGLAVLTGLRRGELFGLRWRDVDETNRVLTVREAIYDGVVSTPKTDAGRRQVPLSTTALAFVAEWRVHAYTAEADAFVFSTHHGHPLSPGNVLRRSIFPTCKALELPRATWLTFRRTYASWSHDKGVSGKVVAQLMGHANVDTTLNVYTQALDGSVRAAAETVGNELFTIVHKPGGSAG
jgi:integrase